MRWIDRAYLRLVPGLACFEEGFGDAGLVASPFDGLTGGEEPARIRWRQARVRAGARVHDGELESPEEALPPECRRARVRLVTGRSGRADAVAVMLASWNDQELDARERLFASVVPRGVDVVVLENAFYGRRRRVGQRGACLGRVSDVVLMGRATVREAHALLAWARAEGYARTGVVGYSMGGQMAAMAAALSPSPVHVVAMAPAVTPASVFLDGPLRRDVAWSALGADGVSRLRAALARLSVLALPPVAEPAWATLVGTRQDLVVPPEDVLAIGRHWGVSPRWLDAGHVSAIALRSSALAQAVVDTFGRELKGCR